MRNVAVGVAVLFIGAFALLMFAIHKPYEDVAREIRASTKDSYPAILENAVLAAEAPRVRGAATITQQLVKNAPALPERTLRRNFEEFAVSAAIDVVYSDNEIFRAYLSNVYLGKGVIGVASAARAFFGKRVDQLTLAECATIAGAIRRPSLLASPEESLKRRNVVLDRMRVSGTISDMEYRAARAESLSVTR